MRKGQVCVHVMACRQESGEAGACPPDRRFLRKVIVFCLERFSSARKSKSAMPMINDIGEGGRKTCQPLPKPSLPHAMLHVYELI